MLIIVEIYDRDTIRKNNANQIWYKEQLRFYSILLNAWNIAVENFHR